MSDLILKVLLPLIGIIIILFCIGAFFFKYGTNIKDSVQEIKIFGADMKISIITVFVLVGLIFVFSGTYFTIVDTNSKLTKLLDDEKKRSANFQNNILELNGQIETFKTAQNKSLSYFLRLGNAKEVPDPKNLSIFYTIFSDEGKRRPLTATLETISDQPILKVTITDLQPKDYISKLVVTDRTTDQTWKKNGFFALSPQIELEKEK